MAMIRAIMAIINGHAGNNNGYKLIAIMAIIMAIHGNDNGHTWPYLWQVEWP